MYSLGIIIQSPPSLDLEPLELALACAAFECRIAILFQGHGLLWLAGQQQARREQGKSASKLLAALPMYDCENVYYLEPDAQKLAIPMNQIQHASALTHKESQSLIQECKQVVSF